MCRSVGFLSLIIRNCGALDVPWDVLRGAVEELPILALATSGHMMTRGGGESMATLSDATLRTGPVRRPRKTVVLL
jgi:hypothetical protein